MINQNLVEKFIDCVGLDFVISDSEQILRTMKTTFEVSNRVTLIIQPGKINELKNCLFLTHQNKLSTYTISKGKNWGLGGKVPVESVDVLFDLGRLNQIRDYSEEFGYLIVEPGVTFKQCVDFLKSKNSDWFLSVIGGPPNASVLANILERGDGFGDYGDKANNFCGMEVFLSNGELVKLGFSGIKGSKLAHLCKHGIGPYLDGLFVQSNLGVVSALTVWLMPKPNYTMGYRLMIDQDNFLDSLMGIRTLYKQRVIDTPLIVWNDYKHIANKEQFPFMECNEANSISEEYMAKFRKKSKIKKWIGMGAVYEGSNKIGHAKRKMLQSKLTKCDFVFMDEKRSKIAKALKPVLKFFYPSFQEDMMFWKHNPFLGDPTLVTTRSQYWRKKIEIPEIINPEKDECGVLWNCFSLPFNPNEVVSVLAEIEKRILADGFEPNIGFSILNHRVIRVFLMIIYDKSATENDSKACDALFSLSRWLEARGYTHFRMDIMSMSLLKEMNVSYTDVLDKLKNTLDEFRLTSPGRYEFK